jgi:hypothetical protein
LGVLILNVFCGGDFVSAKEKEGLKTLMATRAMSITVNFLLLMNLRLVQSS